MNRKYKGIKLTNLEKGVQFSHSKSAYILTGGQQERDINTDYFDLLLERQKSNLTSEQFYEISALNSVANMNYQICNGGIDQYFYNSYDKSNPPMNDEDVAQVDKANQCLMLDTLVTFGLEVFPDREEDNNKLEKIVRRFKDIYVENVEQFETIASDEDKYIWDEEKEEWIENIYYEEVYDVSVGFEDEIFNADNFDEEYYMINDYLELLIEGYAQYLTKSYDKELDNLDKRISVAKNKADEIINVEGNPQREDIVK